MPPPFDARAIANLMLDLADRDGREISNLVLQKLVYFAHGRFLCETGTPLVSGEFEAWQYGPVHPHVYNAFKEHGGSPIRDRAEAMNPVTFEKRPIPAVTDSKACAVVEDVYRNLRPRSAASLVAISHAKLGPWGFIVDRARKRESISLRIPNELIREKFKHHLITVSTSDEPEVPHENSPFA